MLSLIASYMHTDNPVHKKIKKKTNRITWKDKALCLIRGRSRSIMKECSINYICVQYAWKAGMNNNIWLDWTLNHDTDPDTQAFWFLLCAFSCCLSFLFRLQALWGRRSPSLCTTQIKSISWFLLAGLNLDPRSSYQFTHFWPHWLVLILFSKDKLNEKKSVQCYRSSPPYTANLVLYEIINTSFYYIKFCIILKMKSEFF